MKFSRTFTIFEVVGIVLAVVSLLGMAFLRDQIIVALGGITREDAAKEYSLGVANVAAHYNIYTVNGITSAECFEAVSNSLQSINYPVTTWEIVNRRRGAEITMGEGAKQIHVTSACHWSQASSDARDAVMNILVTGTSSYAGNDVKEAVAAVAGAIRKDIKKIKTLESSINSPFEYDKNFRGQFILKPSYLGSDIIVGSIDSLMPNTYGDMGHVNIFDITVRNMHSFLKCVDSEFSRPIPTIAPMDDIPAPPSISSTLEDPVIIVEEFTITGIDDWCLKMLID
jgi:hypothetical protein